MPLVKQGKFKEYYKKCEKIKKKAKKCHNYYFDKDGYYTYDISYSDFFTDINIVYKKAVSMKSKLKTLMDVSEQKTDKSIRRCEMYIDIMEDVIDSCKQDLNDVYSLYKNNLTDRERETLKMCEIYKEI